MTEAPTASSPPFAPSPLAGLRGSLRAGRRSLGVVELVKTQNSRTNKTNPVEPENLT